MKRVRNKNRSLSTTVKSVQVKKDGNTKTVKDETSHGHEELNIALENQAQLTVAGGTTVNMDNFNSVKVYVSLSLPCKPDDKSINDAYNRASIIVDEFVAKEQQIGMDAFNEDHPTVNGFDESEFV